MCRDPRLQSTTLPLTLCHQQRRHNHSLPILNAFPACAELSSEEDTAPAACIRRHLGLRTRLQTPLLLQHSLSGSCESAFGH